LIEQIIVTAPGKRGARKDKAKDLLPQTIRKGRESLVRVERLEIEEGAERQ